MPLVRSRYIHSTLPTKHDGEEGPLTRRRYIMSKSEQPTKRKRGSSVFDISSRDRLRGKSINGDGGGEYSMFVMYP